MNDGGPAFPVSTGTGPLSANFVSPGMSLRDWFAGMAMQSLDLHAIKWEADARKVSPSVVLGELAYEFADAMLAARHF